MKKFNFKPFEKILTKDKCGVCEWKADFFSHIKKDDAGEELVTTVGLCNCHMSGIEIIPYEGNENLIGTTDDYKPKWVPKNGDLCYHVDFDRCELSYGFFVDWHRHYDGDERCEGYVEDGNCFKTEEEAQVLCDKLNKAIKGIR